MELRPDVRLTLPRSDGEVRLQIVVMGGKNVVQLVRNHEDGRKEAIAFRPEELDRLDEGVRECRRVLLGVPDPKAEHRRAQELVGLAPAKPERRRRSS